MAARNGHHVPGTPYTYRHDWRPRAAGTIDDPLDFGKDIEAAQRALAAGKHVRLDQPREVATYVDRLAREGRRGHAINLEDISVPGTNLFGHGNKGIPRAQMPQLAGYLTPGSPGAEKYGTDHYTYLNDDFYAALRAKGVAVRHTVMQAEHMRATQSELNGKKVAAMALAMRRNPKMEEQSHIVVTRDGYILDGHHTWAAKVVNDSRDGKWNTSIPVDMIDMDIGSALSFARKWAKQVGLPNRDISLSNPADPNPWYPAQPERGAQQVHTVQPPPSDDSLTRAVAAVLAADVSLKATQAGVHALLEPFGVAASVVAAALGLASRGSSARPNAKLAESGLSGLPDSVRVVRDADLYYRAAYVINAAHRLQRSVDEGKTIRAALADESIHYRQHEAARAGRLKTAAQVARAAQVFGPLLGWYLNPLKNNEAECIAANGHNFLAAEGTVIGLPGSVHANCGCYAGPPHEGAEMVNDVLHNVVRFGRSKPPFRLRTIKSA